jgi:hypothetical protein
MGLDISYYRKVTLVEAITLEQLKAKDWKHPLYDDGKHVFLWNAEEFEERGDGLVAGFYLKSPWKNDYNLRTQHETEGGRFGAGSYHGYNLWREWLAGLVYVTPQAVWKGAIPSHFGEIINFPDNEGFIGPKTSAKLAKDFEAFAEKVKTVRSAQPSIEPSWKADLFFDFMKAFQNAAGEGIVDFH